MNGNGSSAIVVGGGPAGLVAAVRLAESGVETTLLEAGGALGGQAATVRREGFDLNQGPHALYEGGAGSRELKAMGIDLPRWNPVSLRRSFFVLDGKARRSPGGTAGLLGWLAGSLRWKPEELAGISAAEWVRRSVRSEAGRAATAALIRVATYVTDQEVLPAEVAASQVRIVLAPGVRYLRGGWATMVDALADRARSAGAELRTRSPVRGLRRDGDGWTVEVDAGAMHADAVVLAAGGPAEAAALLGDDAPPAPGPPAEVSVLDLGLGKLPKRSRTFALGVDEPTYLSRHSPPDHPAGTLLSLVSYTGRPRTVLEEMADVVQPGWRDEARLARFLPRMVAVSAIPSPEVGLAGRPAVDRGDGLYLAGDWVGPEGWLVDAAIASGAAAAAALVRRRASALA